MLEVLSLRREKNVQPLVSQWILVDNSTENFEFIAEGSNSEIVVRSEEKWSYLNEMYNGN